MSNQRDGSGAMNIYIGICVVLTFAAGVGYKLMNDKRIELMDSYPSLRQTVADIDTALMPSVSRYYELLRAGDIKPPSEEDKRDIPIIVTAVANKMGLEDTGKEADRLDIPPDAQSNPNLQLGYVEYSLEVVLKDVTQSEWSQFLVNVQNEAILKRYATITKVAVARATETYAKITVGDGNIDSSRWKVSLTLTWFGPGKPKTPEPGKTA